MSISWRASGGRADWCEAAVAAAGGRQRLVPGTLGLRAVALCVVVLVGAGLRATPHASLRACAAAESEPVLPEDVVQEEWAAIYLNGVLSGHQHLVVVRAPAGEQYAYETRTEQEFTIARGPAVLRFSLSRTVRECEDGTVWSFGVRTA